MKYALVDGHRLEALPNRLAVCPVCGNPMVAKCGDIRIHHWAHRAESHCDSWWENETEWHRNWKNLFPVDWQEVIYPAGNGESHIADVKTDQGWVLEFQHSHIHPDERKAREAFYKKLVWIVDGTRRKRDKAQFIKALEGRSLVIPQLGLFRFSIQDECALLRDWASSRAPVFFDFSRRDEPDDTRLWCLIRVINRTGYGAAFLRQDFVQCHNPQPESANLDFSGLFDKFSEVIDQFNQPHPIGSPDPLAALLRKRELQYQQRFGRRRRHF